MFRNLITLALLLVCARFVGAQAGTTGTILGTVTDTTGAVIPSAPVRITNLATGVMVIVTTTSTGDYTATNLLPDAYKVSVEMPGFSTAVVNNLILVVAQEARVNLQLKPGATSEVVEVSASAVALDTDTSSVSQTVSEKQMSELPINGRNFTSLLFVGAGAVQTIGEQGQMRANEGNAISLNGSRPESNNYTLDGLTNTDTALNTPAVILSQDAIQEFKVQDGTYSAEFGFSANQINIVSKSGGNQFHGSIFEFDRNDFFDAIPHQSLVNTSDKQKELRQNQFGYVLSGPVRVPKVYNGHDKTFFLANYEGERRITGGTLTGYAPTSSELSGDFSAFASTLPYYGGAAVNGTSCSTYLSAGNNCLPVDPLTGQPFANNQISSSRFSRMAQVMDKLVPTTTTDNNGGTLNNNGYSWSATANSVTDNDQQTYRLDQTFQKWGQLFFRYTKADYSNTSWSTDGLIDSSGANIFTENSTSWTGAYTLVLPKGFVNNFRFGRLDATSIQGDHAASATDITSLGLTGVFTNLPSYAAGYPYLSFGVNGLLTTGSPSNNPTTSDIPVWEYADSVVKQHGAHSFSFGFDFRSWVQKRNLATNFLGAYSYDSNLITLNGTSGTNGCPTGNVYCGTGNYWADFLLGYDKNAQTYQPGPFTQTGVAGHLNQYIFKYFAPYIEDDWKITPKLTLNLGIRWDFRSMPYANNNELFWLDTQNTSGGLCFAYKPLLTDGIAPDGNGFYRYCGDKPHSSQLTPFAPRFGFAYRPLNKYVVRGGYGIFFDSSETREMDNSGDQYPFLIHTSLTPYSGSSLKSTDDLFTSVSSMQEVSAANNGSAFTAVIISENQRDPYMQQWTLSLERELPNNTTLEVNYVGNKGTHLLERFNVNQSGALPSSEVAHCKANPTDTSNGYTCPYTSRLPLPNFTSAAGFLDSKWIGYSTYNAGNVKLEHRASDGAVLLVYTWSKSLDSKSAAAGIGSTNSYAGPMDSANPRSDYARSDFDVSQRFVASYAYYLPVGRGKKFAGSVNHAVDAAIGGWELTGIGTYQVGFPFSVLANDTDTFLMSVAQRATQSASATSGFTKSTSKWFNTAAFSQPDPGVFGNSGRNILREPGINNWDMGAVKNISFTDRIKMELRLETFNTFNHTQWGVDPSSPGVGPGSSSIITNVNSTNFGAVQTARSARQVQLGGKITF
jgi:hypothetical protein